MTFMEYYPSGEHKSKYPPWTEASASTSGQQALCPRQGRRPVPRAHRGAWPLPAAAVLGPAPRGSLPLPSHVQASPVMTCEPHFALLTFTTEVLTRAGSMCMPLLATLSFTQTRFSKLCMCLGGRHTHLGFSEPLIPAWLSVC